jgi:hypothetical protein
MLNINEEEILVRVYNYQLLRKDGRLHIGVCQRIAGKSHHMFMAYPSGYIGNPEKMYCGFGETESEALRGLLNRIKNVPLKEIEESIYRQMASESEGKS